MINITWSYHFRNSECDQCSVATAKADVFRKNGINVGRKFAEILRILDKIDDVKSRGVI
jgi:hypothetical protein